MTIICKVEITNEEGKKGTFELQEYTYPKGEIEYFTMADDWRDCISHGEISKEKALKAFKNEVLDNIVI